MIDRALWIHGSLERKEKKHSIIMNYTCYTCKLQGEGTLWWQWLSIKEEPLTKSEGTTVKHTVIVTLLLKCIIVVKKIAIIIIIADWDVLKLEDNKNNNNNYN